MISPRDFIRVAELRSRDMLVSLTHLLGNAQADFDEALVTVDGVEQKRRTLWR